MGSVSHSVAKAPIETPVYNRMSQLLSMTRHAFRDWYPPVMDGGMGGWRAQLCVVTAYLGVVAALKAWSKRRKAESKTTLKMTGFMVVYNFTLSAMRWVGGLGVARACVHDVLRAQLWPIAGRLRMVECSSFAHATTSPSPPPHRLTWHIR